MDERTLYQALADAPDDDGPRVVFADWLLERDDPMAEFLALQLAHHRKPLDTLRAQRAQDLLIMHWKRWTGPLHRVLHRRACIFERGFLREADLTLPASLSPELLREAMQWATVRTISAIGAAKTVGAMLTSPWLRNLTHLRCEAAAISGAWECAFRLHTLHLSGAAQVEPNAAWDQLQLLTLRGVDGPLSRLKLTAREIHCDANELDHAIGLVRDALELPRRPERVAVKSHHWEFVLTAGSDVINGESRVLDSQDPRTLRSFGSLELDLSCAGRRYRGPANGLDWR